MRVFNSDMFGSAKDIWQQVCRRLIPHSQSRINRASMLQFMNWQGDRTSISSLAQLLSRTAMGSSPPLSTALRGQTIEDLRKEMPEQIASLGGRMLDAMDTAKAPLSGEVSIRLGVDRRIRVEGEAKSVARVESLLSGKGQISRDLASLELQAEVLYLAERNPHFAKAYDADPRVALNVFKSAFDKVPAQTFMLSADGLRQA